MTIKRLRNVLRWSLATIFIAVSFVHLRYTNIFLSIMPGWVPYPQLTILFTGACEFAGAMALLTKKFRYFAGVMLAIYAVCVFPANIKQAITGGMIDGVRLTWWYHAPRLAFQPFIVWWSLFCGEVIDWPFLRGQRQIKPGQNSVLRGPK